MLKFVITKVMLKSVMYDFGSVGICGYKNLNILSRNYLELPGTYLGVYEKTFFPHLQRGANETRKPSELCCVLVVLVAFTCKCL